MMMMMMMMIAWCCCVLQTGCSATQSDSCVLISTQSTPTVHLWNQRQSSRFTVNTSALWRIKTALQSFFAI